MSSNFKDSHCFWTSFGAIWDHFRTLFERRWPPLSSLGRPWAPPRAPKPGKKTKTNQSRRPPGTPQRPAGCQLDPILARSVSKWVPGWVPGCQNGSNLLMCSLNFRYYLFCICCGLLQHDFNRYRSLRSCIFRFSVAPQTTIP